MKSFIIALLLTIGSTAQAEIPSEHFIAKAEKIRLWEDPYWLSLLHYQPFILGRRSGDRNPGFFVSPRGRNDPRLEMEAVIRSLFAARPPDPNEDVRCKFPLRTSWLGRRLGMDPKLMGGNCPKYRQWRADVHVDSFTLVFASAYLNNPSSMYGHTFFILNQNRHGERDKILDFAVNFAADDSSTNNPILYMIYGTMGGFPGFFSAMPYYQKVQEYNSMESRDLWEYRLNLDAAAVDRLAAHIWEMDRAQFGYYFFGHNCSYQMLPLMEVANPGAHYIYHWPPYVIPIDTVRAIMRQPGIGAGTVYRPSRVTVMLERRARLSSPEIRLAEKLLRPDDNDAWKTLGLLPSGRQALILDSAADYLQYKTDFKPKRESESKEILHRILAGRASIPMASPPADVPTPVAPDQGHESTRVGAGYGFGDRHFLEAEWRGALHDPLDPAPGFESYSALEMMNLKLRHDLDADKNYVQSFDLLHILSLSPYDRWVRHPSWGVDAGMRSAEELDPRPWKTGYFGGGGGMGVAFESHLIRRELAYAMAEADSGWGGVFRHNYRLGTGGTAAWLVEICSNIKLQAKAGYIAYGLGGDPRPVAHRGVEAAWTVTKNFAFRVKFERARDYDEATVGFQAYF